MNNFHFFKITKFMREFQKNSRPLSNNSALLKEKYGYFNDFIWLTILYGNLYVVHLFPIFGKLEVINRSLTQFYSMMPSPLTSLTTRYEGLLLKLTCFLLKELYKVNWIFSFVLSLIRQNEIHRKYNGKLKENSKN